MVAIQLAQEVLLDQRNSDLGFDVAEVVPCWFFPLDSPGGRAVQTRCWVWSWLLCPRRRRAEDVSLQSWLR